MADKPTIRDVARLAGISVTTVSQILNHKGERFSAATQAKVIQAQQQLGYQADYYARGLVGARANSIGVVIPDIMNPFFASLVVAVEQAAIPRGYYPEVFSVNGFHENIDHFINQFASGTQKGLVLAAPGASQEIVDAVATHHNLPMVFTDQADVEGHGDRVMISETEAGAMIAAHLLALGHRRIAIILPPHLTGNLVKRFTGYQQAFAQYHVAMDEDLLFHAEFSPAGGLAATKRILRTDATAIIAINDDVAVGVYRGLFAQGKRIPEDYSVVGFDDISLAQYLTPPLTTITQPIQALGQAIVDQVLARLKDPARPNHTVTLETQLMTRTSTRALNQGGAS